MKLLIFSPETDGCEDLIKEMTRLCVGFCDIAICRRFNEFSGHMVLERYSLVLVIALLQSIEALDKLCEFKDLIAGIPLFLVLPDQETGTIAKGYSLYPRYIGYMDGDFTDVKLMIENKLIRTVQMERRGD